MMRRTSRTSCARAEDVGSPIVFPVLMTKDLGIVGSLGLSVFLTCVRFLVLFLPTIVLSKTGGEKTKIVVDPFSRLFGWRLWASDFPDF
jgi:hypothetical protein